MRTLRLLIVANLEAQERTLSVALRRGKLGLPLRGASPKGTDIEWGAEIPIVDGAR